MEGEFPGEPSCLDTGDHPVPDLKPEVRCPSTSTSTSTSTMKR